MKKIITKLIAAFLAVIVVISYSGILNYSRVNADTYSFVATLYRECLGREADADGFNYWTSRLQSGEITGKQCAYGFVFSEEFKQKTSAMSYEETASIFYIVFLNRAPDYYGLQYWVQRMPWGNYLNILFSGFADSAEFAEKCASYGIVCGDHINLPGVQIDPDMLNFLSYYDVVEGMSILNQVQGLSSHTSCPVYNVRGATTVASTMNFSGRELQVIQEFAATHFDPSWTPAQKVAYTYWWINRNVVYGGSGGCGYAEACFVRRSGQCAQYNGALVEMMCYLGYDACLINGSRGYNGGVGSPHYWGEVVINGVPYVMETGNYSTYGDWSYFCCDYSQTSKYIKNGVTLGWTW
ncbi:MAG: DUF4214 domain-containing protein [Saccharofermentans sp.]|nr:DUF4214 domain-containing protein [Saccharofermentans sp.]